jgi:hypothetical protein
MEQMTNPMRMGSTMLLYIPKEGWYRYWPLQGTGIDMVAAKSTKGSVRALRV